jgi:hypothetical protein
MPAAFRALQIRPAGVGLGFELSTHTLGAGVVDVCEVSVLNEVEDVDVGPSPCRSPKPTFGDDFGICFGFLFGG